MLDVVEEAGTDPSVSSPGSGPGSPRVKFAPTVVDTAGRDERKRLRRVAQREYRSASALISGVLTSASGGMHSSRSPFLARRGWQYARSSGSSMRKS